jgi:hypothetical protein
MFLRSCTWKPVRLNSDDLFAMQIGTGVLPLNSKYSALVVSQ